MRGRLISGVVLSSAGLLAVAALAAAAGRTTARVYSPFAASGRPAVHVTRVVRGYCWTGSDAASRDDAWRCMTRNLIYDPCFSSGRAVGIVLCPTDGPWKSAAVEIRLTRRLAPGSGDPYRPSTSGLPWAIQTTAGWRCRMATGATTVLAGRRLNYFCDGRADALWGAPSRRSEPWTIPTAPAQAKSLHRRVAIRFAWF